MEKTYWLGRRRSAAAMARLATTAEARLIHYDLAGRYSVKASQCLPFMLPRTGPASEAERAALQIPAPSGRDQARRPAPVGDPEMPGGERR